MSRPICLVLQSIHSIGLRELSDSTLDVRAADDGSFCRSDVVALITRDARVDETIFESYPNLQVIGKHGAGTDNIDLNAAQARNIRVTSTPGANAQSVAEHAMMLMMAISRRLPEMVAASKHCDNTARNRLRQHNLYGGSLGLIGFGHVGQRLAHIARNGLNMTVGAYSPSVPEELFAQHGVERQRDLSSLMRRSAFLSVQCPLRPETIGLVDADSMASLPEGSFIVNVARREVLDEKALISYLGTRQIAGAALDVTIKNDSDPLLNIPNVIITPHVAGSSESALQASSMAVARNVVGILRDLETI
jgi:D-3-phosphoglycerate dehydrogenase / 2-oxoglutarate reductase